MAIRRSLVAGLGLALLAPLAAPGAASASFTQPAVATKATSWLLTQQQSDGSFEVAQSPGFETPDAILALASEQQTGPAWDRSAALAQIQAVHSVASGGKSPLDAVDDLVDGDTTSTVAGAARAAKVLSLVADPLGISATDFDPSNDSAEPVDLVARIHAFVQGDGTLAFGAQFNGVLYAAIGLAGAGQAEPSGILGQIEAAQRPDGSWNYAGSQDVDTSGDVDTTAVALLALKALGLRAGNPYVDKGIAYEATRQSSTGAFQSFGSDDPNSTSTASIALSALHVDVTTSAWRAAAGHPATGTYHSPYTWLASQQRSDGRITSPNDGFGVNTFATTQAIEALATQWFTSTDREDFVSRLATKLGSGAADPDASAGPVASDALGPNSSIGSARTAAATAIVDGLPGRQAAVDDIFEAAFGRHVDPSGKAYWAKKLLTLTRPQVLSRQTGSSEFYRKNGSTPAGFVDAVYLSVLGRNPDSAGRTYWVNKITKGDSILHVAQSLVASSEFKRHEVQGAYVRALGRQPSSGELTAGLATVKAKRVEALLVQLGASAEFYDGPAVCAALATSSCQ